MQTTPCGTTRFSLFLRNSFLRLDVFAGAAGAAAASCGSFAISFALSRSQNAGCLGLLASRGFLLGGHGALARTLAGACVGMGSLAAHRKIAAMAQPAVALNFNQPPDVHLN